MELYVWRLTRLGFSLARAYEVCFEYKKNKDFEGLDQYITKLESEWSAG